MKDITTIFNDALSALNGRDLKKAEKGFRRVIQLSASHVPALNLLTIVLMGMGRFAEAEPLIARAVALNQSVSRLRPTPRRGTASRATTRPTCSAATIRSRV